MMSLHSTLPYYKYGSSSLTPGKRSNGDTRGIQGKVRRSSDSIPSRVTSGSTPHAPRAKNPLVTTSSSDLTKNHTYLDTSMFKSPPKSVVVPAPSATVLQAWDNESVMVQPFRTTKGRTAPQGVPCLDLSKFNEPDAKMNPVRVLKKPTDRAQLSWGTVPNEDKPRYGPDSRDGVEPMTSDLEVEDLGASSEETTPTSDNVQNLSILDSTQAKFVESKLLSNERGRPQPEHVTNERGRPQPEHVTNERGRPQPDPVAKSPVGVYPRHPGHKLFTKEPVEKAKPGVMIPEASLSKKLRFEARVITQNGRDIHRELCGFFFMADGSITVYEFRQFGKKSSALPIVQRGVYNHLFGTRRGEPYEVNLIKKGATLHFLSCDHPGLPDTLSVRPVVALRVTYVDEGIKKQILTDGRNPIECRAVEVYLNEPVSPLDVREKHLHRTLQGMLVSRLKGRASKTLVGLGRHLQRVCINGRITRQQLQQALRAFHISLTVEDMTQLWIFMTAEQAQLKTPPNSTHGSSAHSSGSLRSNGSSSLTVGVDGCVPGLVGPMNEDRMSLVRKVFRKLDNQKTGSIELDQMQRFFNASKHPSVLEGQRSPEEVWFSLFDCLQCVGKDPPPISYAEFEHYYHGVSIETVRDIGFSSILRNCWAV